MSKGFLSKRFWSGWVASAVVALLPACGSEVSELTEARSALSTVGWNESGFLSSPEVLSAAAHACAGASNCGLESVSRRQLEGEIYEYSMRFRVGAGAHEVIGLHRVVREKKAGSPISNPARALFMVHGDAWGFDQAFLSGTPSAPVTFAANDVDVWGIDLRWALVPGTVTDFSFMQSWNFGTDLQDLTKAMTFARRLRTSRNEGTGRFALLGWSSGGALAYAYAGAETQRPQDERNINALLPVDTAIKLGAEEQGFKQTACANYQGAQGAIAAGVYNSSYAGVIALGQLALAAPNEASPIIPGFTNRQAALLVGSATWATQPTVTPWYHYVAGAFTGQVPTGTQLSDANAFFQQVANAAPNQALGGIADLQGLWCDAVELPYDDFLSAITVPTFYVGAAGGFGTSGLHSMTLLGSANVSSLMVRNYPEGYEAADLGHVDLWLAASAREQVWLPIVAWLQQN